MKTKSIKLFTLLIILLLHVTLPAEAGQSQRGILWQVSKGGAKPSYVMGTIHSDDPRVMNLPDKVRRAFEHSSSFTAELKMDLTSLMQSQMMMLLADGRDLPGVIGEQRYKKCVKLMADYGIPEMMVRQMKPWAVAAQLSLPKSSSGMFLDMMLYQEAGSQGKQLYGLETIDEQMSVFESMDIKHQITFLDEAIKNYKQLPSMIRTLMRLYLKRDLTGLKEFSDKHMAKGGQKLANLLEKNLVVDRNRRMVERMQPRLQEGNAFIAVGALHLPGEKGILRLLENRGYRVKAFY